MHIIKSIYIYNFPTTRTKLIIVSFIVGEFINLFDGIDAHFFSQMPK